MKTIPLKTINTDTTTLTIIHAVAATPLGGGKQGGTSIDDMRLDVRLLDAVEKVKPDATEMDLEDADWNRLCAKLKHYPFAFANRQLLAIIDDILNAPESTRHV